MKTLKINLFIIIIIKSKYHAQMFSVSLKLKTNKPSDLLTYIEFL